MIKVLIVYNTSTTLEENSRLMSLFFNDKNYQLRVKNAKNATIPDFAWADILLVGTDKEPLEFAKGEFREINRALTGINFAGRIAGFFYTATLESGASSLLRMFGDTDILVYPKYFPIPVHGENDDQAIKSWIYSLCGFYQEAMIGKSI